MADSIHFQYAVYLLPSASVNDSGVSKALHTALSKYKDLAAVDEIPKEPNGMLIHAYLQNDVKNKYPPPDTNSLQYFGEGISRDQAQALQNATQALVLDFGHSKNQVWTALRIAAMVSE
jgi:hypothetical protein